MPTGITHNKSRWPGISVVSLVATLLWCPGTVSADTPPQFTFTPYLFATDGDVSAGIGNVRIESDFEFEDLLENLDNGFMATLVGRSDNWMLGLDTSYMKLEQKKSNSVSGPFGNVSLDGAVETTSRQWIYQPVIGYQIGDETLLLDIYTGARYTRLKGNLDITIASNTLAFPGGNRSASIDKDWTDVVVGFHFANPLSKSWTLSGLADIGAGEDSPLSYQAMLVTQYQFNRTLIGNLGIRTLYQDYDDDSFSWEVRYTGFLAGLGFRF